MTAVPPRPTDPRFAPPSPFARLLWTHAISACGDACVAVSLAGSLFFASPAHSSREKLLLYLLISMAPFAVIWPLLGPALDRTRGGRRLMVALSIIGRALLCVFMSRYITKDAPEGLLVYPLAFGILVLQKSYSVAKSSLVPALVTDEEGLVRANSRLAVISVIGGFIGAAPAAGLSALFDASASLVLGAIVFAVAAAFAVRIPKIEPPEREQEDIELEQQELHQPSILLAGSAMGVLRGSVGFFLLFTAFALRNDLVAFGFAGGLAGGGVFIGNIVAPILRDRFSEEVMLASAVVATACFVLVGGLVSGAFGFGIAGLFIGTGAAAGKVGFDSLLQRDGPDAVRGRAFARFETRFQAMWVIGALFGIIPLAKRAGLLGLAVVLIVVAFTYVGAMRAAKGRVYRTTVRPKIFDKAIDAAKKEIEDRRAQTKGQRRRAAASKRLQRRRATDDAPEPPPRRTSQF